MPRFTSYADTTRQLRGWRLLSEKFHIINRHRSSSSVAILPVLVSFRKALECYCELDIYTRLNTIA